MATIGLAAKARAQADQLITVYLTGKGFVVQLREQPDQMSRVVAILERGTAVTVTDSFTEGDQTWYHVQKAETSFGWVKAEYVSLSPP
jgi:SH3-like domain-containing protein